MHCIQSNLMNQAEYEWSIAKHNNGGKRVMGYDWTQWLHNQVDWVSCELIPNKLRYFMFSYKYL